jgi:anti-sigma B factor antagonist
MALPLDYLPVKDSAAGDLIVVYFAGYRAQLDEEVLDHIDGQLLALADEPSDSDLLLDFGNVEYVSSRALGTLVSLHKRLLARSRHLTVGNLRPDVYEVFAVTRLDQLLDLRLAGQGDEPEAEGGYALPPTGVLVVDDEPAVLCVLAARLRQDGYQVWVAGRGHQAIALYQQHRKEIAVVVLDVLMPGIDGPHTLTALQKLCPTVRCCFMSGNPAP